jgi:DNA invertase Pin-like site-specific DNA recombinase
MSILDFIPSTTAYQDLRHAMKIGYARISTKEQNLNLQVDALKKVGCTLIHQETVSGGAKAERPVLTAMLNNLRPGDTLIIWKLDRLGRSLKNLVEITNDLIAKEVGLQSLNDAIDTTTAQGRLTFNIFAALAEFERDLIRERTNAGLEAARARGRNGGRPKGIPKAAQTTALAAETLYLEGKLSVREIAKKLSISKGTLYAYLRHRGVKIGDYKNRTPAI